MQGRGHGVIGPRQIDCWAQFCRTATVRCSYDPNCCRDPNAFACSPNEGNMGVEPKYIAVCMSKFLPGNLNCAYKGPVAGARGYKSCDAPQCAKSGDVFRFLHEIMHNCGTVAETNADEKACCVLRTLF
jgi:hypothetical protein